MARPPHARTLAVSALATALLSTTARPAVALELTPSQTEGPYYPVKKPAEADADLTQVGQGAKAQGDILLLAGRVVTSDDQPVLGARVEIWQTDHQGIYAHPRDPRAKRRDPAFQGYGAAITDPTGGFQFSTIMPGRYEGRPRHIHVKVTPSGGKTLTTQLYFRDDPDLKRDGIAAGLGPALERVVLAPARAAATNAPHEATITLVVARGP